MKSSEKPQGRAPWKCRTRRFAQKLLFLCAAVFCLAHVRGAVLWRENLETEEFWDRWHVDGGVWAVGTPHSGPGRAFAGDRCAATALDGNYPRSADVRLARDRAFVVPPAIERPRLRCWS